MMALVRGVIRRSTSATSRLYVFGSRSANTGTACWKRTPITVPTSVIGEVTISSPGATPAAATAMWSAAVPEEQVQAYCSGQILRNRSLSSSVCGPFQKKSELWPSMAWSRSRSGSPQRIRGEGRRWTAFGPPCRANGEGWPETGFSPAPSAALASSAPDAAATKWRREIDSVPLMFRPSGPMPELQRAA